MQIALVEPFYTGSHRRWAEGWQAHSVHDIQCLTLAGRHWKWRMHGGAVSLAEQLLALPQAPEVIVASDMLDLASFAGLIRTVYAQVPLLLYMHENQLTYPWSPTDQDVKLKRDRHYAWINYTSALSADRVYFNSHYHRDSFLEALPPFLRAFPDHQGMENVARIREKSEVLPLGMDLKKFLQQAKYVNPATVSQLKTDNGSPVILWNHRWEYDKNPQAFFELCYMLKAQHLDFQLVVLGEAYAKAPAIFTEARTRLADQILHWGYVAESAHYAYWLKRADLMPVTSFQDFFGGSVVEAIAVGVYPLLPNRLAYPEHIPVHLAKDHLYDSIEDLQNRCINFLRGNTARRVPELITHQLGYDWEALVTKYDSCLSDSVNK